MKPSRWKLAAQSAINKAIRQMKDEGVIQDRGNLNEEQKIEFKKRIDAAYPFGARENLPYKMWLEVRKEVLFWYGCYKSLPQAKKHSSKPKIPKSEIEGQQNLF